MEEAWPEVQRQEREEQAERQARREWEDRETWRWCRARRLFFEGTGSARREARLWEGMAEDGMGPGGVGWTGGAMHASGAMG